MVRNAARKALHVRVRTPAARATPPVVRNPTTRSKLPADAAPAAPKRKNEPRSVGAGVASACAVFTHASGSRFLPTAGETAAATGQAADRADARSGSAAGWTTPPARRPGCGAGRGRPAELDTQGTGRSRAGREDSMSALLAAWVNRDLVQGRALQCRAKVNRVWAHLRNDPMLESHLIAESMRGALQARYGHDRAQAEWRLRRIERNC